MSSLYKSLALGVLVLIAVSATAGYHYGKGDKEVVEKEVVKYKEAETLIVYKDRIVTVTKEVKPDGTVTETTKTEEKDKTVDKTKKSTDIAKDTTTTPVLPKYSVGTSVHLGPIPSLLPTYSVTAGYRVMGPVFIEAGATTDRQVLIGVRMEL